MKHELDLLACGAEMKKWVKWYAQYAMARIKTLELWEFTLFKLCLISFGAWLGAAFSKALKKFKYLFFITFLASCIYFIWRIFWCTEE